MICLPPAQKTHYDLNILHERTYINIKPQHLRDSSHRRCEAFLKDASIIYKVQGLRPAKNLENPGISKVFTQVFHCMAGGWRNPH